MSSKSSPQPGQKPKPRRPSASGNCRHCQPQLLASNQSALQACVDVQNVSQYAALEQRLVVSGSIWCHRCHKVSVNLRVSHRRNGTVSVRPDVSVRLGSSVCSVLAQVASRKKIA